MIRFTETPTNIINLDGPDGEAEFLLGESIRLAKEIGYAHDDIQSLTDTMTKSDYTNLVKTFDNLLSREEEILTLFCHFPIRCICPAISELIFFPL